MEVVSGEARRDEEEGVEEKFENAAEEEQRVCMFFG